MENVVSFNTELSGLYDTKPPISKAKMAAITKAAMRAIKFYKHVVQSVEKFILKCKSEYKVPGLYVIDSIVRQSRHQFGVEKDVFAPRFARNMKDTFANLFRCAPEDKSRIIRVLNLWQKNNVFAPEVIQPLFDLADPSHPIYQIQSQQSGGSGAADTSLSSNGLNTSGIGLDVSVGSNSGGPTVPSNHMGGDDKLLMPDLSIGHPKAQTSALDQSTIRQLQQIQQLLIRQTANENASSASSAALSQSDSVKFNKKLLDYDYGDEDEEEKKSASPHVPNLLDNNNLKQLLKDPNVLRQLQTLQNFQKFKQQEEKQHKLNELRMQEEAFEKHIQNVLKGTTGGDAVEMSGKEVEFVSEESKIEVINLDGNDSRSPTPDRDRYKRRRSRSRSRSRSRDRLGIRERRRRSRSRSRSRSPRTNRRRTSRERERERERLAERNRDKEKEKEREHERERRRKGLPDMKKDHLSVCSTTLWVGHLSKLVYQEELSDTFGKYGDIVSIDQIVPRGCAFIVMNRRQDASKAMTSLKNHKLQGRAITISWAAGKGVKSKEWKDFWDLELGVTYIPWDKLEESTDLDALEEGGMFDEDSMPEWMKEKINKLKNIKENVTGGSGATGIIYGIEGMPKIDTTQPPPQTGGMMPIGPFSIAPPLSAPPRLLPPMGVPMPSSMVPGIPMPPGMVAGMPPPHTMMMPPGMLPPPGYPPIPQLDKNIPPPNMRNDVQNISGMPPSPFVTNPGLMQPLPIPTPHPFQQPPNAGGNASSDDQMDIEMEDDISTDTPSQHIPQINFNQPPPMFNSGFSEGIPAAGENIGEDFISRDRNRSSNSRWGAREDRDQNRDRGNRSEVHENIDRDIWRESGSNIQTIGPPAFNDNARRGGGQPINIQPFEISNHAQRSDFFDMRHGGVNDDFNDRRGGGVTRGGGGDFFPNMQNRFNQPNSLMQMRIQPPPVFNNRMGGPGMGPGPGMFMRSQGPRPQGGPSGGGFNFNDRQPFERDIEGNRMRGGRGMNDRRGGGRGGGIRGNLNNWRDNDEEEEGNVFKRRGGGNRFGGGRDRDNLEDNRMSRDRDRLTGGRRQMNDRNSRDRLDRSSRERREGGNDRPLRNRKLSNEQREEPTISPKQVTSSNEITQGVNVNIPLDTEEDWDQELSEHNFEIEKKSISSPQQQVTEQESNSEFSERNVPSPFNDNEEKEFVTPLALPREDVQNEKERTNSINTPLYDEPNANIESKTSSSDKESFAFSENNIENISSEESVPAVAEEITEE